MRENLLNKKVLFKSDFYLLFNFAYVARKKKTI